MKRISFFDHVNNSLNPYRWMTSFIVAVMVSGLFAGWTLQNQLDTDRQIISSLSPYILTLIESSDRPELLRVVQSIAEKRQSDVIVVQDGKVLASNKDVQSLDLPFMMPRIKYTMWGARLTSSDLITSEEVLRADGSSLNTSVYVISPLFASLKNTFGIFIGVFILCVLISFLSSLQMRKAIRKALKPMDQLQAGIKAIAFEDHVEFEHIPIKELDDIGKTVQITKIDLENVKDRLAEVKAKKLSSEAYKSLIHDLHNPVAALRQNTKIANDESFDNETRQEASHNIPRIADQILYQVTAAKKNLEDEPIALRDLNILDCIKDSVQQIQTLGSNKNVFVCSSMTTLNHPHDPHLLKRALINLLENGVEAARSQVRVSVEEQNYTSVIRICDDGSGMDESQIPLFFQGRGISGKANRQAFGLSSTNHIVRSHGGKLIYRKSDLGGSSFEIRLGVV